jgi:hypothetical protein
MEQTDDPALPRAKVTGIVIGVVVQRLYCAYDALPGLVAHIAFAVQHAADGLEGDTRLTGHIDDCRWPGASLSAGHVLLWAILVLSC